MSNGEINQTVRTALGGRRDLGYVTQLSSFVAEKALSLEDARELFATFDYTISPAEMSLLRDYQELSKYEGFSPRDIIFSLHQKNKAMRANIRENPRLRMEIDGTSSDGRPIIFSNDESLRIDMEFICLVFITRGASYDKILRKSTTFLSQALELCKGKYDINTTQRRPGVPLDSKMITIPRIAASFPGITVNLFHKGFGRLIYDPKTIFPDVDLPRALFSPMMPSVAPHSNVAPLAIFMAIAITVDDVLHQTGDKTNLNNIFTYMMALYGSNATTDYMKIQMCKDWGIVDYQHNTPESMRNYVYKQEVLMQKPTAIEYIRAKRGNDPSLPDIIPKLT